MENIKRKQEAILSQFLAELAKLKENETALIEFDRLDYQRTGANLTSESGEDMAKQLILSGIFSENLTVTSWKDDVEHAPSGSAIIAIKSALNAYELELNGLT